MTLRKNLVSNCIWIIYSLFALVFSALFFTKLADYIGVDDGFGLIGVPVMLIIAVGIVIGTNKLKKSVTKKINLNAKIAAILPFAIAVIFLGVGLFLRIREFQTGNHVLKEFFDNSFITQKDAYSTIHGASQLYYSFLRGILKLFGNHYEFLVVFQIITQMLAITILYFPARRLMGEIPALFMLGISCLSPYTINMGLTLGPTFLYLIVIAFDFLVISYIVPFRKISYGLLVLAGILSGILIYLDVTSVILFVMIGGFFWYEEKERKQSVNDRDLRKYTADVDKVAAIQNKAVAIVIFLGIAVAVLLFCFILDLNLSGCTLSEILRAQVGLYMPESFSLYSLYSEIDVISGTLLACMLVVGIPFGFLTKNNDQGTLPFIVALVLIIMTGFSITVSNMNSCAFIFIVLSLLAGEHLNNIVNSQDISAEGSELNEEEQRILEEEKQKQLKKIVHKIESSEEDASLLDNPLPVPVKTDRKKLEYDYFVPEDAEYDL